MTLLLVLLAVVLAIAVVCLIYEVKHLRKAVRPFATFGINFVDSNGWNELGLSTKDERIVDWFGPSDFRGAIDAYGIEEARKAAQ